MHRMHAITHTHPYTHTHCKQSKRQVSSPRRPHAAPPSAPWCRGSSPEQRSSTERQLRHGNKNFWETNVSLRFFPSWRNCSFPKSFCFRSRSPARSLAWIHRDVDAPLVLCAITLIPQHQCDRAPQILRHTNQDPELRRQLVMEPGSHEDLVAQGAPAGVAASLTAERTLCECPGGVASSFSACAAHCLCGCRVAQVRGAWGCHRVRIPCRRGSKGRKVLLQPLYLRNMLG